MGAETRLVQQDRAAAILQQQTRDFGAGSAQERVCWGDERTEKPASAVCKRESQRRQVCYAIHAPRELEHVIVSPSRRLSTRARPLGHELRFSGS